MKTPEQNQEQPARKLPRRWPLALIASPAAVAVWSGWVGLGGLCGFGIVHPLPGIAGGFELNTAITLPVGVEAYGAYALGAWLTPGVPATARKFARRSAIGALVLGMTGQVIYHLLSAAHAVRAPWPVVVLVSCLPVITLGFGAALTHLLRANEEPADAGVTTVLSTVPADVQEAAKARLRLALANSFPLSNEQMQKQFKLTRAQATKVRSEVLAETNGHGAS